MGLLLAILFGIIPMLFFAYLVYWTDHYEKEPILLLGFVFTWGAIVAAGGAFLVNTMLGLGVYFATGSETATEFSTGSLIAPFVEESLKGLAVLIIFLFFRKEFDSILDGIVYAAIVALGFAATENIYYIYRYGFAENGYQGLLFMVFVRVILVGWQHPFYTAFIGIGLALARLNRSLLVKIFAPFLGWSLGVFFHSIHNTLAGILSGLGGLAFGTLVDWSGWLFMFLFILWALSREQQSLITYLREEVKQGLITPGQYRTACSAWLQSFARFMSLFSGRFMTTHRFYQLCGELAHKKHQRARLFEESGNTNLIERMQKEISLLSTQILA